MASLQAVVRTAKGIFRQYNPAHEIPEGAVFEAENCQLDRDGVFGPRRGFKRYGTPDVNHWEWLYEFDRRLLAYCGSDGKLAYDSDGLGTWSKFTPSYERVQDFFISGWSGYDPWASIRGFQGRAKFYLNTNYGLQVTEQVDQPPTMAGVPPGLDLETQKIGGTTGWLYPDRQAGYRMGFGRVTPLGTLIEGAPTMREVVTHVWVTGLAWTAVASTVTVTHTAHGYSNNDLIAATNLSDAAAAPLTGTITYIGANSYSYTAVGTPAGSGTGDYARISNVLLRFSIPANIHEGDFYSIYRTVTSANATTDPGDEQKRVARITLPTACATAQACALAYATGTVTVTLVAHGLSTSDVIYLESATHANFGVGAHQITVTGADTFTYTVSVVPPGTGTGTLTYRTMTYADGLDQAFLAESLYTNPSLEGIESANIRPPWARDCIMWKDTLWLCSTKREDYTDVQCISVATLVDGTSHIKLNYGSPSSYSETYIFDTAVNYSTRHFFRDTAWTTTAQDIAATMRNFCRCVNRSSKYWYAWYTSGIQEAPGLVSIEQRQYRNPAYTNCDFFITVNNATTSAVFTPVIPTTGSTYSSDNFRLLNGVYHSKPGEPESVPEKNFNETLGEPSKEAIRLVPTRDSIFVIKEDGIFRISGDSERTYTFKPLDTTVFGRAPETWVALDNALWGLSSKGVVRVSESGTEIMSKPIEPQISDLLEHPEVDWLAHAVAYESEGLYILFCPEFHSDAVSTIAWVFPSDGSTGPTKWRLKTSHAIVSFAEDRLYYACSSLDRNDEYVMAERKDWLDTDYMDEEVECLVDAIGTYTDADLGTLTTVDITWPGAGAGPVDFLPSAGCVFRKTPGSLPYSKIRRIDILDSGLGKYHLYLSHYLSGLTTGTGTLGRNIPAILKWHPEVAENAAMLKQFSFAQLYFESNKITRFKLAFRADSENATYTTSDILTEGTEDSTTCLRVVVPHTHAVCRGLELTFLHDVAQEPWSLLQRSLEFRAVSWIAGQSPR